MLGTVVDYDLDNSLKYGSFQSKTPVGFQLLSKP